MGYRAYLVMVQDFFDATSARFRQADAWIE